MYFCFWELTILETSLVCACDAQKFHAKIEKKKPGFEFFDCHFMYFALF